MISRLIYRPHPCLLRLFAAVLMGAVSSCAQQDSEPARASQSPNIVLISVDSLRLDHLGVYGYPKNTSPRIDKLAAGGAVFENAVSSSSWTLPAHAALFTGLPDSVHGCYDSDRRLDENRLTLAERFSELGYQTVGFFAGPFLHPTFGLAQGFDRYIDCSSYADASRRIALDAGNLDTPEIVEASHRDITNPRVAAQVEKWLAGYPSSYPSHDPSHDQANDQDRDPTSTPAKREAEKPPAFFMFVHLWDVHFDYVPPAPYDTLFDPDYEGSLTGENFFRNPAVNPRMSRADFDHILALYDGEIAWTDWHIGKILDDLEARGLMENTIVALVADHGEEFFEHGGKGHRFTLYDEVIRIPMILWYPKKIPAGTRIQTTTSIIDIFPTLLDLAGAAASLQPMGRSLVPLITHHDHGAAAVASRLAISELNTLGRNITTFRSANRKLLLDNATGRAWSYDLRLDRHESLGHPVAGQVSDWERDLLAQAKQLRRSLKEHQQMFPASAAAPHLSGALVEQLKLLGYLDAKAPEADRGP